LLSLSLGARVAVMAVNNVKNDSELRKALPEASRWYVRLQASDVDDRDHAAWQAWLSQSPSHQQAWQQVENLSAQLGQLPSSLVRATLNSADISRRQMLRHLGMLALVAPLGFAVWQLAPWQQWSAQYATATGEQRRIDLPDGSQLTLNTASAVDIQFDSEARHIRLYQGEILVETAHDPQTPSRPFFVDTPQGRVQALGTRFTVRLDDDYSRVAVLEKTVRIFPGNASESLDLHQGQQASFSKQQSQLSAKPMDESWWTGNLMVVDMPLRDLLNELSRYRKGSLTCVDEVAALKISGAFPLKDTDRALAAITRSFPVREERFTPWWVRLVVAH